MVMAYPYGNTVKLSEICDDSFRVKGSKGSKGFEGSQGSRMS